MVSKTLLALLFVSTPSWALDLGAAFDSSFPKEGGAPHSILIDANLIFAGVALVKLGDLLKERDSRIAERLNSTRMRSDMSERGTALRRIAALEAELDSLPSSGSVSPEFAGNLRTRTREIVEQINTLNANPEVQRWNNGIQNRRIPRLAVGVTVVGGLLQVRNLAALYTRGVAGIVFDRESTYFPLVSLAWEVTKGVSSDAAGLVWSDEAAEGTNRPSGR